MSRCRFSRYPERRRSLGQPAYQITSFGTDSKAVKPRADSIICDWLRSTPLIQRVEWRNAISDLIMLEGWAELRSGFR
jgi:hypothetical protein